MVSPDGRSIRVIPICCNCSKYAIALNFDSIASIDYNKDKKGFSTILQANMSHQEINISVHTNEKGIVSLDIPTGIIDRDVRLKVSFEVVEQATAPTPQMRVPGIDEGRFVVPNDFDDPLPPDLLEAFEGKD